MIGLDSLTLLAWYRENCDFLKNARIQKIQQSDRKSIILSLRKEGISKKLYINIDPTFYHLCFMSSENEALRELTFAKQPPMFCMLLRKYLEGAKISDSRVIDGERVFEIDTEKFDEFSDQRSLRLTVELMGKYSNIILYNNITKIIIGSAHNIGEEKSRNRQIIGGLPYEYPPIQMKKFIETTPFKDFVDEIKYSNQKIHSLIANNYFHFTLFGAKYLLEKYIKNYSTSNAFTIEELQKLYNELVDYSTLNNYIPQINFKENFYFLFKEEPDTQKFATVNEMVDTYYAKNYIEKKLYSEKDALIAKINKDILKIEKINQKLAEHTKSNSETEKLKLQADLIMSHMYENIFNSNEVCLLDYVTNQNVLVEFDTSKSPVENANLYYKKYAKCKKAIEINEELTKENAGKIALLKDYLYNVRAAESLKDISDIKNEIFGVKDSAAAKKDTTNIPTLEINGFVVYAGKNNRQNDFIYSKLSSPNDLWFHILNQPGAHILIKVPKGKNVDDDTLLKCAKLAKQLSSAATSGKTSVIYTKRQFIKRPPKTQAGYVTFKNETEIVVE